MKLTSAFLLSLGLLAGTSAHAAYPDKTITIIVPAAAGGTTDIVSRLMAEKMGADLGQTVVVENRAGAGGIIGTQALVRSKPDGYTIIMGNIGPNAINYSMYDSLPYTKDDFEPITLVISVPNVLVVNEERPVNSVAELIEHVKSDPKNANFGSSGKGQSPHMSAEMFLQRTGIDAEHIAYKGAGPAVTALLGNQYAFMIDNLPSSLPSIQAGKLKALAVTSDTRVSELPDVPTMKEAGVDNMVVTAWFGLLAPAGTPAEAVDTLYKSAKKALESDDIKTRFASMGGQAGGNTPAEFSEYIANQQKTWAEIVEAANLKMD